MNVKLPKDANMYIIDKAIRIQGTDYDRKRKVTKAMKAEMEKMRAEGKSYNAIANYYNVSPYTVQYNLDEEFKKKANIARKKYGNKFVPTTETIRERAEYKWSIISK